MGATKQCSKCRQHLPLKSFQKNKAAKDGKLARCKDCANTAQKEARKNPKVRARNLEYSKKYKEQNKDNKKYRLKQLWHSARARAREKGREFDITFEYLLEIYPEDNRCPVYGTELQWGEQGFRENSPSIDRIDSNRGYTEDNVQIISWKANRLKAYATLDDLETLVAFMKQGA